MQWQARNKVFLRQYVIWSALYFVLYLFIFNCILITNINFFLKGNCCRIPNPKAIFIHLSSYQLALGWKVFFISSLPTRWRSSVAVLSFPLFGFSLHLSFSPVVGPLAQRPVDYDRVDRSWQHTAVTWMVPFTLVWWTRGTGAGAFPLTPPTICQDPDRDRRGREGAK